MKVMKNATQYFITMFFIMAAFYMTGITANAAGITQTGQTKNSVTISWPAESRAKEYYICIGSSYSEADSAAPIAVVPMGTTTYTFTGLQPGTKYEVFIKYKYQGSLSTRPFYVGHISIKTLPEKVSGVNQEKWWYETEIVDISWKEQPEADYEYVIRNSKNKIVEKAENDINKACFLKASNTMVYNIQVRAYVTINEKKYYGEWSDKAYIFPQPRVKNAKISGGKLKLTWHKVSGVTGYDVYVSTKEKKGYKKVKTLSSKKSSVTISKLKGKKFSAKKTYYIYIVGKKKVGNKTYTSGRLYSYKLTKGKNGQLKWSFINTAS